MAKKTTKPVPVTKPAPAAPAKMKEAGRQIALLLLPADEKLLDDAQAKLGIKLGVPVNRTQTLRWLIGNASSVLNAVSR